MDQVGLKVRHSGRIELKRIVDERDGALSIIEGRRDLPFDIRRVYYINQLENGSSIRGKHAHRQLQQAIFCINGSFILSLDDGVAKQDILMWRDHIGIYIGPGLWHTMHSFSSGCVLLVAASDYYEEADYIRNYEAFLEFVRQSDDG